MANRTKFSPRRKQIALKYHHFRAAIENNRTGSSLFIEMSRLQILREYNMVSLENKDTTVVPFQVTS